MFTGIVEELGVVRSIDVAGGAGRLEIDCRTVRADAVLGASIAVNGSCLTVVELGDGWWAADAQPETLARTTLGTLAAGDPVNLERPVRLSDRLGGHLVQGHVDGIGRVSGRRALPDGSAELTVAVDRELARYVVEKGSITIDGVSLTVTEVTDDADADAVHVGIALIPHTLASTTLGIRAPGEVVNLEVDVLAKYVERLLAPLTAAAPREP
jgi:riboflavin synthase